MTMLSPFCTRLLEPNSLAIGNKIKTKLKFGINYIGKKNTKAAMENIMIDWSVIDAGNDNDDIELI